MAKRKDELKVGDRLYRMSICGNGDPVEMIMSEVLKIDTVNTTLSNQNGTMFKERNTKLRANIIASEASSAFRSLPWRRSERQAISDASKILTQYVRWAERSLIDRRKQLVEARRGLVRSKSNLAKFRANFKSRKR